MDAPKTPGQSLVTAATAAYLGANADAAAPVVASRVTEAVLIRLADIIDAIYCSEQAQAMTSPATPYLVLKPKVFAQTLRNEAIDLRGRYV